MTCSNESDVTSYEYFTGYNKKTKLSDKMVTDI